MSATSSRSKTVFVDCDAGRALGCNTFCCRLLVRLDAEERVPVPGGIAKGFVDKEPDGTCVHFDKDRQLCTNWDARPRTCRDYDCNADPLLQVVLRDGFRSLVQIASAPMTTPRRDWIQVPYSNDGDDTSEQ